MDRKQIEQRAREAEASSYAHRTDLTRPFFTFSPEQLERFAALVAAHEREQCALECEQVEDLAWALWKVDYDPNEQGRSIGAGHCAQAIRARGEVTPSR